MSRLQSLVPRLPREVWFLDCVDPTRFVVYGSPSPAARELLAGFGGTYLGNWGGFDRHAAG